MAFKLKSGNTSSFKNMGSSPAKHKIIADRNWGHKHPHGDTKDKTTKLDYDWMPDMVDPTEDKINPLDKDRNPEPQPPRPKKKEKSPAKDMKTGSYSQSFEDSPVKQGISTLETDEERLKRVRREEMENEPKQGVATPETDEERKARVRKEEMDKQIGPQGVDTTPRTYGPKKKSPAKQVSGDAGEAVDHWKKYKAAKIQDKAVEKLATDKNISRKAFDTKLAKTTKTVNPNIKSKMPKNFNMSGKDAWVEESKKILKKSKKVAKKGLGKTILKGVGNVAKRFLGPVGVALTTYDILKHGIKNVKEGKAKIPKGYYEKGGKGYQKRDYSKKKK
jgi:hypothetical protein